MKHINYSIDTLKALCNEAFEKFGFSQEDAAQITDVLILADLYNIRSHGTQRLVRYHKAIEKGSVRVDAVPKIVFETPVSAVIDGQSGMGQLIASYAMRLAIEKAKQVGMAFVSVRNSNHFGIAGYYSKMACDAGFVGISATNSESIMVHTGSKQAVLGSNPIAFAMPADPHPFWFDAATTVVPKGKLEVYNKEDKQLFDGWAVDESGSHKGYGFSMICELLCAIMSGGATSNHHVRAPGVGAGTCHAFIVINPAIFGDPQVIKDNLSVFMQELRDAKRADEDRPIYTHGEKEIIAMEGILKNGLEVDITTVSEMKSMCEYLGIDHKKYRGDVDLSLAKESVYN